jgi:hypothetical protein
MAHLEANQKGQRIHCPGLVGMAFEYDDWRPHLAVFMGGLSNVVGYHPQIFQLSSITPTNSSFLQLCPLLRYRILVGFPDSMCKSAPWLFRRHRCQSTLSQIIQIIINRIALLMRDKTMINRLKWGTAIFLGMVNISVYCIWIPARLQISQTYIQINEIWDRIEKVIFCLIDVAYNVYFIYLVRSRLISNGLNKYNRLFYFNIGMIFFSMSLDVSRDWLLAYQLEALSTNIFTRLS